METWLDEKRLEETTPRLSQHPERNGTRRNGGPISSMPGVETRKDCPRPPVVPSFRRWDWGGCQEGLNTEPEEVRRLEV